MWILKVMIFLTLNASLVYVKGADEITTTTFKQISKTTTQKLTKKTQNIKKKWIKFIDAENTNGYYYEEELLEPTTTSAEENIVIRTWVPEDNTTNENKNINSRLPEVITECSQKKSVAWLPQLTSQKDNISVDKESIVNEENIVGKEKVVRKDNIFDKEIIDDKSTENDAGNIVRLWIPEDTEKFRNNSIIRKWQPDETTNKVTTNNSCVYYKSPNNPFDLKKMADIWQTVYYQLQDKLQCFKIHIRKVSDDERHNLQNRYGTFDDKVDWNNVFLEIRAITHINRKHFLQGNNTGDGVMKNIIIIEDNDEKANPQYYEESADQWQVSQKLLFLRDCDSGGIVVFSKVPYLPLRRDVAEGLEEFNEQDNNGSLLCDDDYIK